MKNIFFASTHPCFDILKKRYVCAKCEVRSIDKRNHNLHVIENHSWREASNLMSWKDFKKHYPQKYEIINEEYNNGVYHLFA